MAELQDEALLLRRIPYSDTSLICHFLTREHGRVSLMARGARRAKSPFRAALSPLYRLSISWRPGRTGMGNLVDIDRGEELVDESRSLEGLELCAVASGLFQDGDSQGFAELLEAITMMQQRPRESALCIALWQLLLLSGWVGDVHHCWECGDAVDESSSMSWDGGQLVCRSCGNGMAVSAGMRKAVAAQLVQSNVRISQHDLLCWQRIIQDVLRQHGVRPPSSAAQER